MRIILILPDDAERVSIQYGEPYYKPNSREHIFFIPWDAVNDEYEWNLIENRYGTRNGGGDEK